jgi:DNA-binding GntR family transcriptional regulator
MAVKSELRALERNTLGASVYASLKRAIIAGELPPGSRVTEKMIEQRLGVSRTPVREALVRLAQERLLIVTAYKGYAVNHPSPQEVQDIHQVIIALIKLASEQAMQRATDGELDDLLSIVDSTETGLATGQIEAYGTGSAGIRRRIAQLSRNATLSGIYDQLLNQPAYIQPWAIDDPEAVHRRALDFPRLRIGIQTRDGDLVGAVLADKLQRSLDDVVADLETVNQVPKN